MDVNAQPLRVVDAHTRRSRLFCPVFRLFRCVRGTFFHPIQALRTSTCSNFSQSHFMLAPNLCFAAFYLQRSCLQCLDGSRCQMVHAAVSLCQCSRCLDLLRARLFGAWVQHRRVLGLPAVHFRRHRVRSGESRASNARLFEYNVPITVALSPTRLETRMGSNVCSNKHLSCLKPSSFDTNYCFRQ